MKKISVLLPILLIFIMSCSKKTEITVISFNVRNAMAHDGVNDWNYRKQATINMIEKENPDLFGLQEAYISQTKFIKENCPDYEYVGVGRDDGFEKGEMMDIFYKSDRFNLLDDGTFWLSETPDLVSKGWDGACKRTLTWASLKDKASGKKILYLNTHLDHIGVIARREAVKLIVEKIKELSADEVTVILTGDFNSTLDDEIFYPLRDFMSDARTSCDDFDSIATFNDWEKPLTLIDYVFYRNAEAVSCHTLTGNYGAPFISDHYPVKAVLRY